ncbi:hypothetical protein [Chryseobacterium arthrosphaerae]|uniref:TRAFAC clade GTPase domain-containing protein n=1 Tax=Chryseobacterium arthrosphaerae TaxID=651561 RepID=UPI001F4AAC00|nr:hypothetical protein [Chryseobacterium arthrosphaerae]
MGTSILLIGKPHSSKTVFLSQFYTKLSRKKSQLKLYKSGVDLTPISGAREALASGEEPQPTPAEKSEGFYLPIQIGEEHVDLKCPEYGGEQVVGIVENRELNKEWKISVQESNNWVLFIRLNNINKPLDISDITYSENQHSNPSAEPAKTEDKLSDESFFIELLQIILHARNFDYHFINSQIKLTVVLTCWDEMNTKENPRNLLETKLPLFLEFVESNWNEKYLNFIGLSAQGFSLKPPENKEKYEINGPEEYGYIILPDGTKVDDITQLIGLALS